MFKNIISNRFVYIIIMFIYILCMDDLVGFIRKQMSTTQNSMPYIFMGMLVYIGFGAALGLNHFLETIKKKSKLKLNKFNFIVFLAIATFYVIGYTLTLSSTEQINFFQI